MGAFEALTISSHRLRRWYLTGSELSVRRMRDRELQVHAPAVAQHHQKEAQAPARTAYGDTAVFAPERRVNNRAYPVVSQTH